MVTFEPGKSYCIQTEKEVQLNPGAPWSKLIKQSIYCIRTVEKTPEDDSWWMPTDQPHIALHRKKGTQYILCTLDRNATIRGRSEFIDPVSGEIFQKAEVSKYLPYQGRYGAYLCVGLDTIRQVDMIEVEQEEGTNKLPF